MFSKLFLTPIKVGSRSVESWKVGLATATSLGVAYKAYSKLTRPKWSSYTTSEEAIKGATLNGKVSIVTGANTGIGKDTARCLLKAGAKVIMACRSEERAEKAKEDIINTFTNDEQKTMEDNLEVMLLDLGSLDSVYKFSKKFVKDYDKLDILVNNAGVMGLPEYKTTKDGFEMQFGVNHIGHCYLTLLLTPLLIQSKPSRVIMVSSHAHKYTPNPLINWLKELINDKRGPDKEHYSPFVNYGKTKSCNILFGREYNKRYNKLGVNCVSLHPGVILGTELTRDMKLTFSTILRFIKSGALFRIFFQNKSVSQGAATTLRCCVMSDEELMKYSGHYFSDCNSVEYSELREDHRESIQLNEINAKFFDLTKELIQNKEFSFELN